MNIDKELKNLWETRLMAITIVFTVLGTVPKDLKKIDKIGMVPKDLKETEKNWNSEDEMNSFGPLHC